MRLSELLIIAAFAVVVAYALATSPIEDFSFDPLGWITNSINGFLDLLKDLFFGWLI